MDNEYGEDARKELCFLFYVSTKEFVNRFNKYLKQYNISFPNYMVLLYIENNIPIYIKTLCEKLYLDSGTISPIIKRLEKKKLIQRIRTQEDERRVKVQLTEEGIELKKHFNKISEEVFDQFDMEEEDTRQYHKILKKFTQINVVENSNES